MQVWLLTGLGEHGYGVEVYVSREAAIAGTGLAWVPLAGGRDDEWVARRKDAERVLSLYPVEVQGETVRSDASGEPRPAPE